MHTKEAKSAAVWEAIRDGTTPEQFKLIVLIAFREYHPSYAKFGDKLYNEMITRFHDVPFAAMAAQLHAEERAVRHGKKLDTKPYEPCAGEVATWLRAQLESVKPIPAWNICKNILAGFKRRADRSEFDAAAAIYNDWRKTWQPAEIISMARIGKGQARRVQRDAATPVF